MPKGLDHYLINGLDVEKIGLIKVLRKGDVTKLKQLHHNCGGGPQEIDALIAFDGTLNDAQAYEKMRQPKDRDRGSPPWFSTVIAHKKEQYTTTAATIAATLNKPELAAYFIWLGYDLRLNYYDFDSQHKSNSVGTQAIVALQAHWEKVPHAGTYEELLTKVVKELDNYEANPSTAQFLVQVVTSPLRPFSEKVCDSYPRFRDATAKIPLTKEQEEWLQNCATLFLKRKIHANKLPLLDAQQK